tara:strand:- start:4366 stop:5226 length:861 start_codon:yes stop_codon:yes gene_type:complete
MKSVKYFLEFIIIKFFFLIFKFLGYKIASSLGYFIGRLIGPFFRSRSKILSNLEKSKIGKTNIERNRIITNMWGHYGRILSDYIFLNEFRNGKLKHHIKINGLEYLDKIIKEKKPVVFISGHFNNFELMAMQIENYGVKLAAIYRPLNNFFLNETMEKIRKNYICKNQIKKGRSGTRKILEAIKNGYSIALMIDQRVSEGIAAKLFGRDCLTTTIPAQLVRKYNCDVVPVYIERKNNIDFELHFYEPLKFNKEKTIPEITTELNNLLEGFILKNPNQWIWSHDRWK